MSPRPAGSERGTGPGPRASFSVLDEHDRLRLFGWATDPLHALYLAILRVFDAAHETYTVQLRVADVRTGLETGARLPVDRDDPNDDALLRALDALTDSGVLQRSQDIARVASIAEYRRRRPVYQFTELGYRAFRNVDEVLRMRPGEGQLQRFAFGAICDDLRALAAANADDDAVKVHRYLRQLDSVFTEMADKAGQFYVLIGQLAQQHEARPEVFLEFKDRLIGYLQDFLTELQRYKPLIAAGLREVEATGIDLLVERATEADDSPFVKPVERAARWRARWEGLAQWFAGGGSRPAAADELDRTTARAISDLSSLLRRVTESRSRGISRASELAFLARWITALERDEEAHALFTAAFSMSPARHLSVVDDRDVPTRRTWWQAEPVEVAATLRRRGSAPTPGRPAPVPDDRAAKMRAREVQRARLAARDAAERSLAEEGVTDRVLEADELALLLGLLSRALAARDGATGGRAQARHGRLHLSLAASDDDTVVKTCHGVLTLHRLALEMGTVAGPGKDAR